MALGWSGAEVLQAVEDWFAYVDSPAGRTIQAKGFFTAAQLRKGEKAPDAAPAANTKAARDAQVRAYIEAQYARVVQH